MKFYKKFLTNKISFSKYQRSGIVLATTVFISFSLSYGTVYAGLFSFMGTLLDGNPVSAKAISQNYGPTAQKMSLLEAAVNSDPNPIKNGDNLPIADNALIPDIAASNDGAGEPVNTQISTYIVRQGDTISGIAHMFGVTSNTILWANNLNGKSTLIPGKTLVILPISGITYTVKKGDTLQSLAKKYKADINDIITYNDMQVGESLSIGDTIIIPNVEITISVPTKIVFRNNPAHDTNGPDFVGYYIRPITGGFRTQGLHGYNAVDLADRVGTPILASAAGTVIVSRVGGYNGGYGSFIIISHNNGTQTLYAHLSRNYVSVGDNVSQGQIIGLMGATGKATGTHLHFEIRGAKNPF